MAEGGRDLNGKNTLPQRGKVQKERQKWAVYEDGAIAHNMQSEEFDKHYGINRFNRRTVREDIPIAKVVQSDEELRLQNERFEQLQALRAQAEEDERLAKQMLEQEQLQQEAHKVAIELTDEEFAKAVQEKEKVKYEKYLSKKKLQKLKQEREAIERSQVQRSEEAGLARRDSAEALEADLSEMTVENGRPAQRYNSRITPAGKIEDDGDFSDFYDLPEHVDPNHRQYLQEMQDEELAKLLQEQEHKRSKAEVDRNKLKEIEEQDKRLAEIIQEQEKIRLKKAKQKKKQQEEQRRAQQEAIQQRPPALPPRNHEHDHRRYRRNSFIQSMENGPDQADEGQPAMFDPSAAQDGYMTPMQVAAQQRLQASGQPRSTNNRQASMENAMNNSRQQVQQSPMSQKNKKQNKQTVQNVRNNLHSAGAPAGGSYLPPAADMPDVERWLASQPPDASRGRLRSDQSEEYYPDSPSPPGSYHSEDAFPPRYSRSPPHNTSVETGSHYAVSDPFNYNIATAIDPTYNRRSLDVSTTERKQPVQPVARTPVHTEACTEIEWDPSVRGSIRRGSLSKLRGSACYINGYQDRTMSTMSSGGGSFVDDGHGGVSPFVPVQGQKRSGPPGEKVRRSRSPTTKQKNNSNCKQQ